ncbi:glycosyltransferase [Clostridium sp. YIM B02555]|uniref:glycosyltransferase n=1 Tax=Clostridium sp. YIM B02555 TaxID=2911968 RepID=UPI001EED610C|nr:glycosyltransferase [Clostridium sp. YIM B02555]
MSNIINEGKNLEKNYSKDDSPLVSILMAVYKPNERWFIEQLISLNEQTYENIELLVYDDCPNEPVDEKIFEKYITNFSYTITRGIENMGSNKAFEELTKIANGELFAYCDQDDIWEKDKITLMIEKFYEKDVTLVCSDLSIIDENGMKIANSITEIRKRIVYKSGYNLAKELLITNFVTGCAMLVKKEIAKKAIPFEEALIHDQWIAIIAALNGKIEFINKSLVRYRQHSFNQTGILKDVYDKQSYYNKRIKDFLYRYKSFKKRINNDELKEQIKESLIWLTARENYFLNPNIKDFKIMMKYRKIHKVSILIESVLPIIPENAFKFIIKLAQKGIL